MIKSQTSLDGKKRVALLFGGRSAEHEVSLSSAVGVLAQIDRKRYAVHAVRVDRDGTWWLLDPNEEMNTPEELSKASGVRVLPGDPTLGGLVVIEPGQRALDVVGVDVAFPLIHGTFGEDGTLQGALALAAMPCVGAGVLGASVGMDKVVMKQLLFQNELLSVDYLWFTRKAWGDEHAAITAGIVQEIGFPCFVKPANAGSSVGISKVRDESELNAAIEEASRFDRKILVEKGVNCRELECAVLGNDQPVASVVGEIFPANEFYDYEAKYQNTASRTVAPAEIDDALNQKIRWMAVKVYQALDCAGLARVDFMLDKDNGSLYVNEINTLPGFTPISMYPQLWDKSGISYTDLISRLIELALERFEEQNRTLTSLI